MIFEYYNKTLYDELKNKTNDNYFSEPEIWYILDTLLSIEKTLMD